VIADFEFRSLHAPGLEEDDLFAAMYGLPGQGALWGDGRPSTFADPERRWSGERARRERHDRLMRKWPAAGDIGGSEPESSRR
jgi:hypothetical protein